MRELKCRDLGMKCDFVAKGDNSANVKKQMMNHGKKVHGSASNRHDSGEPDMMKMDKKQMEDMEKKMDKLLA